MEIEPRIRVPLSRSIIVISHPTESQLKFFSLFAAARAIKERNIDENYLPPRPTNNHLSS